MSAQPTDHTEAYEVIHLAEIEAALAGHDEWLRAGRPGARTHDEVMAELLGE
jgi:hypothetical protein